MFCVSELISTVRGRRVPFSCFELLDSFSAVPSVSGPVIMFYAPGLVFGGTEGVGSRFHVLRDRTHFRRYQGRQVPFSCFVRRTRFWRYRGRRIPFSYFALPNSFSAVPRASGAVFMFCAPGLVFGGTEGVRSCFHVFRSRTCFWRYRGRRVPFSRFPLRDSFWRYRGCRVPFSCFARSYSFSTVMRSSDPVFLFCAPRLVFGGVECVGCRFHVLRARTRVRRYQGRQDQFSCFAHPDSFSTVPRVSGPVFKFWCPRTGFWRYRGRRVPFSCLAPPTGFWRYRGRRASFSCFALPDSFSAVPGLSGLFFMFCAPRLVYDDTEGVGSRFHVLRSRTLFRSIRGRRVLCSCFAFTNSFSAMLCVSGTVFMFCAPEIALGGA
jgi:hypothetical protein